MRLLLSLVCFLARSRAVTFEHGWGQLKTMMWADYRSPNLLNHSDFMVANVNDNGIANHFDAKPPGPGGWTTAKG
jgi:hypothetical protein